MKDGSGLMKKTEEDIKRLKNSLIGTMGEFIWD